MIETALKNEIISFAKEISNLPKELVKSSSTNNAYTNLVDHVVKMTILTYYHFDKPPLNYVVKFLELHYRTFNLFRNVTEESAFSEIEKAKELYLKGEKVHLTYKTISAIGDYETLYKVRYFPYGESAEGYALLVMIEGETSFGTYRPDAYHYNYIDENDTDSDNEFFDDEIDFT
ncbi:MAG: hypothetical protein WKF91_03430 [Segetibacter sp.]